MAPPASPSNGPADARGTGAVQLMRAAATALRTYFEAFTESIPIEGKLRVLRAA